MFPSAHTYIHKHVFMKARGKRTGEAGEGDRGVGDKNHLEFKAGDCGSLALLPDGQSACLPCRGWGWGRGSHRRWHNSGEAGGEALADGSWRGKAAGGSIVGDLGKWGVTRMEVHPFGWYAPLGVRTCSRMWMLWSLPVNSLFWKNKALPGPSDQSNLYIIFNNIFICQWPGKNWTPYFWNTFMSLLLWYIFLFFVFCFFLWTTFSLDVSWFYDSSVHIKCLHFWPCYSS